MMNRFYAVDKRDQDKVFSFDDSKSRNKWIKKDNANRGAISEDQVVALCESSPNDIEEWVM